MELVSHRAGASIWMRRGDVWILVTRFAGRLVRDAQFLRHQLSALTTPENHHIELLISAMNSSVGVGTKVPVPARERDQKIDDRPPTKRDPSFRGSPSFMFVTPWIETPPAVDRTTAAD